MRLCYAASYLPVPDPLWTLIMLRQVIVLTVAALLLWVVANLVLLQPGDTGPAPQSGFPAPLPETPVPRRSESPAGFVADISLHTEAELETLLGRVEQLLERPRKSGEAPLVALVLHGPEVEFFALKNYPQYRLVVDHAAKLAALGAVDISICQTQMRTRGIGVDEVPGFLRQVPYGPEEVQRLLDSGYVYM
jgi:intracellular sulfur oxidation DsrE/DsrF family protein